MTKGKKKLASRRGETIGETLIALLISALAMLMLAGAISSASNMLTRNRSSMDTYYKDEQAGLVTEWAGRVDAVEDLK